MELKNWSRSYFLLRIAHTVNQKADSSGIIKKLPSLHIKLLEFKLLYL